MYDIIAIDINEISNKVNGDFIRNGAFKLHKKYIINVIPEPNINCVGNINLYCCMNISSIILQSLPLSLTLPILSIPELLAVVDQMFHVVLVVSIYF